MTISDDRCLNSGAEAARFRRCKGHVCGEHCKTVLDKGCCAMAFALINAKPVLGVRQLHSVEPVRPERGRVHTHTQHHFLSNRQTDAHTRTQQYGNPKQNKCMYFTSVRPRRQTETQLARREERLAGNSMTRVGDKIATCKQVSM